MAERSFSWEWPPSPVRRGSVVTVVALVTLASVLSVVSGAALGATAIGGPGATADPAPSHPRPALDDGTVHQQDTRVTGTIRYEGPDGSMHPARQVDVQIRKVTASGLPNPVIATTTTDDSGDYEISLDVAANENSPNDDRLQVRVQALASSPAVEVLGFSNNFQGGSGRIYHVSTRGQITVGQASASYDLDATGPDTRRAFQVTQWALEAREFNEAEVGFTRRQADANLNASLYGDRYLAHIDKIKLSTDDWDATKNFTVYHEYGHGVQDALWDYELWEPPKLDTWLHNQEDQWFPCHAAPSETSELYAWYEGFPAFFEAAVNDDPRTDNKDLESIMYFNQTWTDPDCHDGDGGPHPDFDGAKVEGAVANVLWDVYDGTNEPHDDINASLREIYATISADQIKSSIAHRNTRKVKNLSAFWEQFRTEENHAALGRIYFEAGIQMPDKFEPNDRGMNEYEIRHGVTDPAKLQNGYPVDGYTWEDGAQQNYGDSEDHYRFPAMANERVTVTINSTQGNADFDLGVYGPKNAVIAESQTAGSNESVQFQAPTNGRYMGSSDGYQIRIKDSASGRTAGTYIMNVTVEDANVYDDDLEDNDGLSRARTVSPDTYTDLKLTDFDSTDVYAVDLDADESLSVDADFEHAETDIDLYVYGPSRNAAIVAKNTSDTDDEELTYHATQAGTHYVKIFDRSVSARQVSYDLTIETHDQPIDTYESNDRMQYTATDLGPVLNRTAPRGDQAGTVTEGLTPDDVDYYAVKLNAAESLRVTLRNSSDAYVTLMTAGDPYLDSVDTAGRSAVADPRTTETVYVQVESNDWVPRYDLEVGYGRGVTSDHLEPNNDYDHATEATPEVSPGQSSGTRAWKESGVGYALEVAGDEADEDVFAVQLGAGEDLTATATYPSYRELGMKIVGESGQTTTGSETQSGKMEASVSANQAGTYYVRLTDESTRGESIDYDLSITTSSGPSSNDVEFDLGSQIDSSALVTTVLDPLAKGMGTEFDFLGPFAISGGNQSAQPCLKSTEKSFTRTLQEDLDVSGKWGKVREHRLQRLDPCKVVVTVDAPRQAEVDLFVTLDGSLPTASNHAAASQNPGSQEALVLKRSDGLVQGALVRVFAEGYPVAGTYDVTVEIFTPGGN